MLFIGGKNFIKRDKEKRAMEEAAMAEDKSGRAGENDREKNDEYCGTCETGFKVLKMSESEDRNREAGRVRNG